MERFSDQGRRRIDRKRDQVERILNLAEHLPEPDRLLVEQVYRHGRPVTELARLTQTPPRSLQRRLSRLVQRVTDPQFRYLAARGPALPPRLVTVARRRVFAGQPLRAIAADTGRSLHQVRQCLAQFNALADRWS